MMRSAEERSPRSIADRTACASDAAFWSSAANALGSRSLSDVYQLSPSATPRATSSALLSVARADVPFASSPGSCSRIARSSTRRLGPRLDAELLDEQPSALAEHGERLGLPTAAVEREHQRRPQLLAEWRDRHAPRELPDDEGVATELELRGEAALECGEPPFVELLRPGREHRRTRHVYERRSTPQARSASRSSGTRSAAGSAAARRPSSSNRVASTHDRSTISS